jgi:hypothetical protein
MERAASQFMDELSMDVIVKSFNRPYCLDRCLRSITRFLRGVRSVRVLDDGTPDKFLDEIQRRHPEVEISRSERHAEKSAFLTNYSSQKSNRLPETMSVIPWDLWRCAIKTASHHFLLLEDDQWCVREMDLGNIGQVMKATDCAIVRLFQSPVFDCGRLSTLSPELCRVEPWYLKTPLHTLFYKAYFTNQCKLGSVLRRLGIADGRWALEAYAVYVVCGIFDRSFWLEVTRGAGEGINERLQLFHALKWAARHRHAAFARTTGDQVSTTFRSSSSSGELDRAVGFDMVLFNQILNEHWLAGRLDSSAGMPGDFPKETVLNLLSKTAEPRCTPEKWLQWCDRFTENFRNLGCPVG